MYDRKRLMEEGLAFEIDDEGHLSAAGMLMISMDVTFDLYAPWIGRKRAMRISRELLMLAERHGLRRRDFYRLLFAWRRAPHRPLAKACEVLNGLPRDDVVAALARAGFSPMGSGEDDD
jgi:hypothetical protein